jgi:hypothetical protein
MLGSASGMKMLDLSASGFDAGLDLSNSVGSALDAVHIMRSASLNALVHSGSASALASQPLSEGPLDSNTTIAPVQLVTDTFASVSHVASNVAKLEVRESEARCFQRRARLALFVNRDTLQVLVVQPLLEVQTNRFARIAVTPDDGADTLNTNVLNGTAFRSRKLDSTSLGLGSNSSIDAQDGMHSSADALDIRGTAGLSATLNVTSAGFQSSHVATSVTAKVGTRNALDGDRHASSGAVLASSSQLAGNSASQQ